MIQLGNTLTTQDGRLKAAKKAAGVSVTVIKWERSIVIYKAFIYHKRRDAKN